MGNKDIWENIDSSEITNCENCSVKMWKFWNVNLEEQHFCSPCLSEIEPSPKIRISKYGLKKINKNEDTKIL
jgi:hypothetical protein